jgi:hypothetical protein
MSFLWMIIIALLFVVFSVGTIYLALEGFVQLPGHEKLTENQGLWILLLLVFIVFVAGTTGEFGRGWTSSLPWKAFITTKERHGIFEGIFSACQVFLVDLWLLWIPANMWINHQKKKLEKENGKLRLIEDENYKLYQKGYISALYDTNKRRIFTARTINFFVGLLLMTPHNPIYYFSEYLAKLNE